MELIPPREFERIAAAELDADTRLELLADMCRLNALVAVKRAGSGHLGSTFSSLDLVAHLLWENLNVAEVGFDSPDRDVFFSSKGHDVPGLYAALNALGVVPTERLLRLRRLGGLDGHPDVGVPGIEANSGSLGMGISKARGIAWAKRHLGRGGRVVVMTGDGELQEGQNWEALQAAAHQRTGRLLVIVDRNELQSDRATEEILALESLEAKLRAFGCRVVTCDGHDHTALRHAFGKLWQHSEESPGVLVAQTIKGKGVSFMEHPRALAEGGGTYRWHAGAPGDEDFAAAARELESRLRERIDGVGLAPLALEVVPSLDVEREGSLQGEPESGAGAPGVPSPRHRGVRRRGLRGGAARARGAGAASRGARRRPGLRLPRARVRARGARPVRGERDRRAGHGLDGRGHGPARAPARRQLVCELPRVARQRADLQPGERAHEGRLRDALRGPDPRRAGEVAPEPPGRVPHGGDSGRRRRPSLQRRGDAGARRVGRPRGDGERRPPSRDRPVAAEDRAARRATGPRRASASSSARAATR